MNLKKEISFDDFPKSVQEYPIMNIIDFTNIVMEDTISEDMSPTEKHKETLDIWKELTDGIRQNDYYDFEALEPYIAFFDDIPTYYKKQHIIGFMSILALYITNNHDRKNINMNEIRILLKKERKKILEAFLVIKKYHRADYLFNENIDYKNTRKSLFSILQEIKNRPYKITKEWFKDYLNRIKEHYNLKNSLSLKQLVDSI